MRRNLASICMLVLLLSMCLFGCASGQGPAASNGGAGDTDGITLRVGQVSGKKGDTVTVPVSISKNSYLVNADFNVLFDSTKVKLLTQYNEDEASDVWVTSEIWSSMLEAKEMESGKLYITMAKAGSGIKKGGTLFLLQFEILDPLETPAEIRLESTVFCTNAGSTGADVDALAAGTVKIENGQIAAG